MSLPTLLLFFLNLNSFSVLSTTEFIFNTNFNSSNLLFYGDSTVQSSILSLTNDSTTFSMGRALYPSKIATINSSSLLPFSTSFIFSVAAIEGLQPGHGFAFVFVPNLGLTGASSSQHLGLFNLTNDGDSDNRVLAIEFDVFENQEFQDINDNHVGLNFNSLTSRASNSAGYWDGEDFKELKINNGRRRPRLPLIRVTVGVVLAVSGLVLVGYVIWVRRRKRKMDMEEGIEDWELEYWPHRFGYKEIYSATDGFLDRNVIGFGGNGKVYKGVLPGGVEVAVKRISLKNDQGMREFLAEISSLGRLKHRNLVGLKGWCKKEKGSLILVYDYMENGSLDKRIFDCDESLLLNWEERKKVLKDVASGILYLHEGWEVKVLHRDIKASNVLLDKEMNARLGDFGLAKMHDHDQLASTTRVVGTVGYMAPEVVKTGRASAQTDVYGFGVLVLEVVSGRRPIEEGSPGLVAWAWRLMEAGELLSALDERIKIKGGYNIEEVEKLVLLGLACAYPEPQSRPTMRQVMKILEGASDVSELDERFRSNATSSMAQWDFGGRGVHPTFEDIKNSISTSTSLSGSDIIRVGR
ncbi:hypothetical protein UlMin_020764 [Ulmus minor]